MSNGIVVEPGAVISTGLGRPSPYPPIPFMAKRVQLASDVIFAHRAYVRGEEITRQQRQSCAAMTELLFGAAIYATGVRIWRANYPERFREAVSSGRSVLPDYYRDRLEYRVLDTAGQGLSFAGPVQSELLDDAAIGLTLLLNGKVGAAYHGVLLEFIKLLQRLIHTAPQAAIDLLDPEKVA